MRYTSFRTLIALAAMAVATTALHAQQRLTYYGPAAMAHGGIFKDVHGITSPVGTDVIAAVGSDDVVPANGLLAYHNGACIPTNYTLLTNPAGNLVDAKAICNFGNNRVVGCFFDPGARASDIVFADLVGNVIWQRRLPNFHVKDVTTFVSPNQSNIWVTGFSTDAGLARAVVVAGLDGAGNFLFHTKYVLSPNVVDSEGFEIAHNPGTGRLTVVGRVRVNACLAGTCLLRLTAAGGWINGIYYYDAACGYDLVGKALVVTPGTANDYSVVMDHHVPATGNTYVAYLQVAPSLGLVAGSVFLSSAFGSNDLHVDGLDADGNTLLASGIYTSGGGVAYGMTWNIDPAVPNTIQFNEYTTLGIYSALFDRLVDLDYYPGTGQYYIGGEFVNNPAGGGAAWPIGPGNVAFWLIGANANGNSDCNDIDAGTDVPFPIDSVRMRVQTIKDTMEQSPLVAQVVSPGSFNQCVPKRSGPSVAEMETVLSTLHFAYLEGKGLVRATIPTQATGEVAVTLMDLHGRVLRTYNLTAGIHDLDVGLLSAGVYLVRYEGKGIPAGVHKIAVR